MIRFLLVVSVLLIGSGRDLLADPAPWVSFPNQSIAGITISGIMIDPGTVTGVPRMLASCQLPDGAGAILSIEVFMLDSTTGSAFAHALLGPVPVPPGNILDCDLNNGSRPIVSGVNLGGIQIQVTVTSITGTKTIKYNAENIVNQSLSIKK